ncbi:high affinity cGMP-specific 3',5'-cyclic phosphodiesterase 9A-like isoform X2 [Tubulanus polymorphus]|uniref:high affinity cGMP-specific 3',5'-cyclic phosphodiesterase 9A-like isoform X2 n=1 Tax=Tubulanus polymorphus TaxID=672921 RepID=UPI003DA5B43B
MSSASQKTAAEPIVIYVTVGEKDEQVEFYPDDDTDDVRETFRTAAEAGPNDIVKLYNIKGNLVNISPRLKPNTIYTRYKLEVVAANISGTIVAHGLGLDPVSLESRITSLEKRVFVDNGELNPTLLELKTKVETFKEKLEGVEHLSWLGLFKDMSCGTSLQPFWNKKDNSKKNFKEHYIRVFEKFRKLSQVQVTDEVREYLRRPTFDNWQWDDSEMLILLQQMYIDLGFIKKYNIEMYGLTWLIDLRKYLDDLDILVLITSSICHDLDHPGYNNAYQINARTELALMYNDISPLENHHCATAFEILEKKDTNIFRNLPQDTYKKIREGMIRCILATDMAKHTEITNNFKMMTKNFDFNNKEHKSTMMMILIKVSDISNEARPMDVAEPWIDCLLSEFFNQLLLALIKVADISNEVRPFEVSDPWAECLLEEFFQQSDVEKLEGLPVAPFMDRDKVSKPSSQVGFIKYVLLPLFEALGQLFPIIEPDIIDPVRKALDYYTDMQQAVEEERTRKLADNKAESPRDGKNGLTLPPPNGKVS